MGEFYSTTSTESSSPFHQRYRRWRGRKAIRRAKVRSVRFGGGRRWSLRHVREETSSSSFSHVMTHESESYSSLSGWHMYVVMFWFKTLFTLLTYIHSWLVSIVFALPHNKGLLCILDNLYIKDFKWRA